jgi:hypothetical protein
LALPDFCLAAHPCGQRSFDVPTGEELLGGDCRVS